MLRSLNTTVAAAALSLAFAGVSHASIVPLGTFSGEPGSNSAFFGAGVSGAFTEDFTFKITNPSDLVASITNSVSGPSLAISDFKLSLFSGIPTSPAPALESVLATTIGSTQTGTITASDVFGDYYVEVTGTTGGTPSFGTSISFSISAVPLPPAAALFGAALVSLAGFGYGLNRWVAPRRHTSART